MQGPKAKQGKSGRLGTTGKTDPGNKQQPGQQEKKSKAFDQGLFNNSNTQTGTANSGYDENNPKQAGGKQQHNPKVTNQENEITNSEEQNKLDEEPVEEQSAGITEKKIPIMKGE